MKKLQSILVLIISTVLFLSCSSSSGDTFIGTWSKKDFEIYVMEISKSGDNFLMTYGSRKKHIGILEDGVLTFDDNRKAIIGEDGNIVYNNSEWIPYEQTTVAKYEGTWKDEDCIGCSTINISFDKKKQTFSVKYPQESYYMLDVERTDNLLTDIVEYNVKGELSVFLKSISLVILESGSSIE